MKRRGSSVFVVACLAAFAPSAWAQELGPQFREIKEGIYVQSAREANTAVWLPEERVLFSASVTLPNSINNIRPFVAIPDMLAAIRMMKSLNPEVVVPGHGSFGTTAIFDDSERYYELLLDRVGAMVREGKSLDQIKQDLRMPEYEDWSYQERMPSNVEAAYRAVGGG